MVAKAKIVAWLLSAISAWGANPIPKEERDTAAFTRSHIATDMVTVSYDNDEAPVYAGPYGRAITALTLTSIASLESRFLQRIIMGDCLPHECDHYKGSATAIGLLQVHPGPHGMRLLPRGKSEQCRADSDDCMTIAELTGEVALQIRMGLHVLRTQGFGAFSPANEARAQAAEWLGKHPVPATDAEVMASTEARL